MTSWRRERASRSAAAVIEGLLTTDSVEQIGATRVYGGKSRNTTTVRGFPYLSGAMVLKNGFFRGISNGR